MVYSKKKSLVRRGRSKKRSVRRSRRASPVRRRKTMRRSRRASPVRRRKTMRRSRRASPVRRRGRSRSSVRSSIRRRSKSRSPTRRRKNSPRRKFRAKHRFGFPVYNLNYLIDRFSEDDLKQMFGFTDSEIQELKGNVPIKSSEVDSLANKLMNMGIASTNDDLTQIFANMKIY